MFRFIRYALIIGSLSLAFFLLAPLAGASECSFFLWDQLVPDQDVLTRASACRAESESQIEAFALPSEFDDTLFGRRVYARLADNALVYPEPSRGVAPVRNVGDGFLFATVNSWDEVNGATWYQINHGEYVHEEDIQLVTVSDFQGVEVLRQPERPFGWIVQDVQPSSQPDGESNPSYAELPRFTFFEIYDAAIGQDDWIWYDIGNGRWIRQTYVSVVDASPRPDEVGPDEFWTEVDLYEQTFAAYEGDRMVYATLISSGLNRWPTREGLFQVWQRFGEYKMSGAEGKVDYYFLEDVPYIMYFDQLNSIGLHGTYWHDRYGYKHSHGCVNMPILDAEWTFNWSADAPNDLWVWVHTSDATNIFN
ncbi:MAG: L,D-transpeptidase family protein [Chloroflexi bacterium]|nr:L,D-transpeptidase family protein [Chloroflexota bacterium]